MKIGTRAAFGPPEDVVKEPRSYTGQFLKLVLTKKYAAGEEA